MMPRDAYRHLVAAGFVPLMDFTWLPKKNKGFSKKDKEALQTLGEEVTDTSNLKFKQNFLVVPGFGGKKKVREI